MAAPLATTHAAEDPHAGHEHMQHGMPEPAPHGWMTTLHGYAFLITNYQGGPSGDRDFESANHLMVAARHALWGGRLSLLGTFTLEPVTVPPEGSALLFQRGETYRDVLLVDRQHPHDLFLELAVAWERQVAKDVSFRGYVAPAGEPPVGPVAYTHRLSASGLPAAPLSHHNLDSTHLSNDVISAGVTVGPATLEAGVFHGREPGENRFDIDGGRIDSYAGRVSVRPVDGLSLQMSAARREHPESTEDGNQTRQTASAAYEHAVPGGALGVTLAFGRNLLPDDVEERGMLLEALWTFGTHHTVTGRIESVDRDVYELIHKTARPEGVPPRNTRVDTITLGYLHDLPAWGPLDASVGIAAATYRFDSVLDSTYGSRPISGQLFLRLQVPHAGAGGMHHHPS